MLELFSNPGYLAAGGALVSAPVIIHLINRMRFRRVRWAAMEFLLKSQKRNRRKLIIEQLLLLLLRCFLVLLTALLVMRFVGFTLGNFVGRDAMHVVLLDDTVSMGDRWVENGEVRTAFDVAKQDMILGGILQGVAQSTTNERLAIVQLSKLIEDPDYQPVVYEKLSDSATRQEIEAALQEVKVSDLHVPLLRGVQKAESLLGAHAEKRPVLHIVSDFRQADWSGPEAGELLKAVKKLAADGVAVHRLDCAHPYRTKGYGGIPISHDNVGIVDFRPSTRVVGEGMPVSFTVTVANFSPNEKKVHIDVYDDATGTKQDQIDFNPPMPLKVPTGGTASATFEMRLYPGDLKPGDAFYQKLSAHLLDAQRLPLENDGLDADNTRYAALEVRKKVPILIVDGENAAGREESKDSFFIENAIISVPGGSYQVDFGDTVSKADSTGALESPDLMRYPTAFLLNVEKLTKGQLQNLEAYVREGGGAAFFLGPRVDAKWYNENLYKGGKGVFPAPLRETYLPPRGQPPLQPKFTGDLQLLLRDKQWPGPEPFPVFGAVFTDSSQIDFLKDLPLERYFPVPRSEWAREEGKVFELATLPNDKPARDFQQAVLAFTGKLPLGDTEYREYSPRLAYYRGELLRLVEPGSSAPAYKLAGVLAQLLADAGVEGDPGRPNLTEFWKLPDPKVRTLRTQAEELHEGTLYGDPFIVAQKYGKGRVVAVMSTAGKDWNSWGGGSGASFIYQPFVWETQNYLSSQSAESNLTVGTPIKIEIDPKRYKKPALGNLMTVRSFYDAQPGRQAKAAKETPNFGTEADDLQSFLYPKNLRPGFYLVELFQQGLPATPLASYGYVFNVDTAREGRLQRVAQEEMAQSLGEEVGEIRGPRAELPELANRQTDLSESPLFFLLFIIILICEQALAVHLSFHLKGNEAQVAAAAQTRPAAA